MRHFITVIISLIIAHSVSADSPITSTDFFSAYKNHKMVRYAIKTKKVDKKIAKFLCSKRVKLVEKAAVINAISWDFNGQNNADLFMNFVKKKYAKDVEETDNKSSRDIQFCYGYLMAMDDYFDVKKATKIMEAQIANYPNSYTAQIIIALVKAQNMFSVDWCGVWKVANAVDTNTGLKADMKPEARKIIMDYMSLYKDSCN